MLTVRYNVMKILVKKTFILFLACLFLILASLSFSKEEEMSREDYLKEIDTVKELLNQAPMNSVLHNALGYYLFKIGEHDSAKEEYKNAIKYDKGYSVPYNNLGVIALIKEDYKDAEEYFANAIECNPEYAKAVYNLGVTYFRQKKYIKAVKYYLKAKKVDKEYVKEREDIKKGEKELKQALKDDPDNKVLKYLLKKSNEKKND
jgi:tetratricopeptide (TPR) repeat protein